MSDPELAAPGNGDLAGAPLSRRDAMLLAGGLAISAGASACAAARAVARESNFDFEEVPHGADGDVHVPAGHSADVVIAWGDLLQAGRAPFDPRTLTAEGQEQRFGTESDFIAFLPLPRGSAASDHGLLCVNHEGSRLHMMFPGLDAADAMERATREQIEIEMAAQGHSVVEVRRVDGHWRPVLNSSFNRRISARSTPIALRGPAAGHARLRTSADPAGSEVLGTFNCCAGGVTPWGTVLFCEENFNKYFVGRPEETPEARNHVRCDVGHVQDDPSRSELEWAWHRFHPRFRLDTEPNEPNRFGWVVEYDPYDPDAPPVKRTSLGRFKHEGATCALDPDGRVVVYMGDDDELEYVYKWVSARAFDPARPEEARDLLDEGTLYAAAFRPGNELEWRALVHGQGPLTEANGFASQADVLIEARTAAELLGATPMDRPEDIEVDPMSGRVYVALTNNKLRGVKAPIDDANPIPMNRHGHVLEILPALDAKGLRSHAAERGRWEVFLIGGDPHAWCTTALYGEGTSRDGWLSCPDNLAFDPRGRLWIATDGGNATSGICDGVWATEVLGPARAVTRRFLRGPVGCEICGPCFTPDGTTLFVAIQHPGEADARGGRTGVSYSAPTTRFPDYRADMPPRSAVIAVVRDDGRPIGG